MTLDNDQAAEAAVMLGARRVVPAHFEGWAHFRGGREELAAAFVRHGVRDRIDLH